MFKAVIFDIDGTLTRDISWVRLTKGVGGSIEFNDEIFKLWGNQELSEKEAIERIIQNWSKSGKGYYDHFYSIFTSISLREDAKETIKYLKDKEYKIAMITGSFDLYANIVGKELEVDDWFANTNLIWDSEGKLVDVKTVIDDNARKIDFLKEYCLKNNFKFEDCAAVGDSANDIGLFELTGNGIAVRTEFEAKELETVAWKKIDHLIELKNIL